MSVRSRVRGLIEGKTRIGVRGEVQNERRSFKSMDDKQPEFVELSISKY